jgi:hypothetical protein
MESIKHLTYKFLLVILISGLFPSIGISQVDSLKAGYAKEFDSFSNSIKQDFESFQQKNDSIFLEFLGQSWKSFDAFKSESAMKPKPKDQPVREKTDLYLQPIKPGNIRVPNENSIMEREKTEEPEQPDPMNKYPGMSSVILDFYGSEVMIIPPRESLPRLRQVSPLYFVEFFEEAARSSLLNDNILSLRRQADKLKLNDWGLLCLFNTAAKEFFQGPNEQTLFIWFGLIRCGYNVKTGYDQNKVYLLVPSAQDLYNTVYFNIKDKVYFLLKLDGQEADVRNLNAYEADYPGNEVVLSLMMTKLPVFPEKITQRKIFYKQEIIIDVDQNLVDFFSTYPECDLTVTFSAPLSDLSLKSLKNSIQPALSGLNDTQKVEYLLKLIQYGFPYKADEEQFGKENYLFPEEVLFYPYSDCEDRSALFARLVEYFTELKTIALSYPDHVTTAVNLPSEVKGAFVDYKGQRYFICDPTYIGGEIGMAMKEYENIKPDIIPF